MRIKHVITVTRLLCLAALLMLSALTLASIPAKPSGYVNDYAHMLTMSQAQNIATQLKNFDQKTSNQIVVATFNSLNGQTLEDFSIKLAEQWKIGSKAHDNGVILLIIKNNKRIRLEVGYGLEGALPDALTGTIIRHQIAPYFTTKNYNQGIENGVKSIMQATRGEYKPRKTTLTTPIFTPLKKVDDNIKTLLSLTFTCLFMLYALISISGNLIISTMQLFSKSAVTKPHKWFGRGCFFSLTLTQLIIGLMFSNEYRGSSSGDDSFFGGGGSFGGGGASGSW